MVDVVTRVRRPLFAASVVAFSLSFLIGALGYSTPAIVLYVLASVIIAPVCMLAAASPRPGLLWYGSCAEPWRAERSPGEPRELSEDLLGDTRRAKAL